MYHLHKLITMKYAVAHYLTFRSYTLIGDLKLLAQQWWEEMRCLIVDITPIFKVKARLQEHYGKVVVDVNAYRSILEFG